MNALDQIESMAVAHFLASSVTLVREYFPEATASLAPWRDDPETKKWSEPETWDMAFHFPGWSPRMQCRSLLIQMRISSCKNKKPSNLIGVLIRGMTFDGERWRLVTAGDWQPTGPYLPAPAESARLKEMCRDLFSLFTYCSSAWNLS